MPVELPFITSLICFKTVLILSIVAYSLLNGHMTSFVLESFWKEARMSSCSCQFVSVESPYAMSISGRKSGAFACKETAGSC